MDNSNISSGLKPNTDSEKLNSEVKEKIINEGNTKSEETSERKRRRKSRWQSAEQERSFIPGMPTIIPSNMSKDQEEAYLLKVQIEEFSRRLRTNDLGIPWNPEERSPSPEPVYNHEGKRMNTREYRTRKKLEEERHFAVQKLLKLNPDYKPPPDYKALFIRICERVMIPVDEHPNINFLGLLIGPRGNTLRQMEKDTGSKIIIRGKGSIKEGKVAHKDGNPLPGEDEPLHAYVSGNNPDSVAKGVKKVKDIIRKLVEAPTGQTDWRKMQLRELALLNGTLREVETPKCSNCGSSGHRSWQCTEKQNVTTTIICAACGSAGHIARDCRPRLGMGSSTGGGDKRKFDQEYMSFMAELGEGKGSSFANRNTSMSSLSNRFGPPKPLLSVKPADAGVIMPPENTIDPSNAMRRDSQGPQVDSPKAFPPPPPSFSNDSNFSVSENSRLNSNQGPLKADHNHGNISGRNQQGNWFSGPNINAPNNPPNPPPGLNNCPSNFSGSNSLPNMNNHPNFAPRMSNRPPDIPGMGNQSNDMFTMNRPPNPPPGINNYSNWQQQGYRGPNPQFPAPMHQGHRPELNFPPQNNAPSYRYNASTAPYNSGWRDSN